MSYILDALRKADAERERDPARGIHAQPATGVPLRSASRPRAWIWPAACAASALAAAFAFWGRVPQVVATSARPVVAAVPAGLTAATPAPAPAPAPAAPVFMPVATTVMPPPPAAVEHMAQKAVVAPRISVARAASQAAPAASPAAPVAAGAPAASVAASTGTATATAPAAATSSPSAVATAAPVASLSAADRVLAVTELPPDVQHALPKLAITGGVHSENAAQRMLIVNGQVMTEGQELAPGVLLEQIRPRSAVLRFRGYRYSVAY